MIGVRPFEQLSTRYVWPLAQALTPEGLCRADDWEYRYESDVSSSLCSQIQDRRSHELIFNADGNYERYKLLEQPSNNGFYFSPLGNPESDGEILVVGFESHVKIVLIEARIDPSREAFSKGWEFHGWVSDIADMEHASILWGRDDDQ